MTRTMMRPIARSSPALNRLSKLAPLDAPALAALGQPRRRPTTRGVARAAHWPRP